MEKCNDCGGKRDRKEYEPRQDVCNSCMDIRGEINSFAMSGKIPIIEFQKYQKLLRGKSYKGRAFADAMLEARKEQGNG